VIYFQARFLEEANKFIAGLDGKVAAKLLYTIDLAQQLNDPRLFKKLTDEMKDKYVGKKGTPQRDKYEYELNMEMLSYMIKKARLERNLTQEQLGKLIGVQKAQISKLESSANSATIDTILKVFKALKADIHFNIKIENNYLQVI
jgi:DNA-binding XRE family transcriptional regulator